MRQRHLSPGLEHYPSYPARSLSDLAGSNYQELIPGPVEKPQSGKRGGGAEILLGELEDCLPSQAGPERVVEEQELAEALNIFLRGLSLESRAMFLRRYWYGQNVAEVAEALGCGAGKVKSSLFRSRKALRAYLEQEGITV